MEAIAEIIDMKTLLGSVRWIISYNSLQLLCYMPVECFLNINSLNPHTTLSYSLGNQDRSYKHGGCFTQRLPLTSLFILKALARVLKWNFLLLFWFFMCGQGFEISQTSKQSSVPSGFLDSRSLGCLWLKCLLAYSAAQTWIFKFASSAARAFSK